MRPTWTRSPEQPGPPGPGGVEPKVPRENGAWRVEKAIAGFRRSNDRFDRTPARSRHLQGEPPVSQVELERVADEYRHVHEEHRRAEPLGRTRRHLEARLRELRARFERLLAAAPLSDRDRRRWRRTLRAKAAPVPPDAQPLLFRGRSGSGSEARLTAGSGGTVEVRIDGALAAVLDDADELTETLPGFAFDLDGVEFRETFDASPPALADLRASVENGRSPRSAYVRELIADGLVDRALGLTPRGRRALALDRLPARQEPPAVAPVISVRGPVPPRARATFERALADAVLVSPQPVLHVTGSLTRHEDPALPRPVVAKATVEVNGRPVRAHVEAPNESEAIRGLESRLRRSLRRLAEREIAERHEGRPPEPGEWRHRDIPVREVVLEPEYRFVEHGGEVEVELAAGTETGILAAGLDAFAELVAEGARGEPARIEIELEARDRTLLLADWLEELLFRSEIEQFVPTEVESIELANERLRATVAGYRGTPRPLVKGVSLNELRFEQEGGVWHGRVVLDV